MNVVLFRRLVWFVIEGAEQSELILVLLPIIQLLLLPLVHEYLLLLDQLLLLDLGLLLNVILVDQVLDVQQAHSSLFLLSVDKQGLANLSTDIVVILGVEVVVHFCSCWSFLVAPVRFMLHRFRSTERSLHSEDICIPASELSPDGDSASLFFISAVAESGIII